MKKVKDILIILVFASLCFLLIFVPIQFYYFRLAVTSSLQNITKDIHKTSYSYRAIAVDLRRYWIRDASDKKMIMGELLKNMQSVNKAIGKIAYNVNSVSHHLNIVLDNAGKMISNTDVQLNQNIFPNINNVILSLNKKLIVVFNDFIGISQDIKQTTAAINQLVENSDIKVITRNIKLISDNTNQATFQIARIMANVKDITNFYKMKLTSPSKWDKIKWLANILMWAGGEILVPMYVTQKMQVVK